MSLLCNGSGRCAPSHGNGFTTGVKESWMSGRRSFLGGALLIGLAALIPATTASAIPAFARKYKTSCSTCHEAFPRLNAVGEAFRLGGYRFADDELYVKDEKLELGDEAYKKVWPQAIWPTDIPWLPPLAIVFDSKFLMNTNGQGDARSEFLFPNTAKLIGAGSMGDNMSFYFELGFARGVEGGEGAHHSESAGGTITEVEGWLQFEDLVGPENAVNLRVGTVGMQELGLFMARDHNRLSANRYLYSSWTMPGAHGDDFAAGLGLVDDP
ncbi:hypothetical protein LCGC14_1901400, partial [marine sediment metagenome]